MTSKEPKDEGDGSAAPPTTDYYTREMLHQIYPANWFTNSLFRGSPWLNNIPEQVQLPLAAIYQHYHPYVCHACKRGTITKNTDRLLTCGSCKIVKYCCRDHQKMDWKSHKHICKVLKAHQQGSSGRNSLQYANRLEWSEDVKNVVADVSARMGSFPRHSSNIQIVIMQPRCRKCFRSGVDKSVDLVVCPRCGGVALCRDCLGKDECQKVDSYTRNGENDDAIAAVFHWDAEPTTSTTSGDDTSTDESSLRECDGHLLALCCMGMLVEFGNPLAQPCKTDSENYWNPTDWREYFARKRGDFDVPLDDFMDMAPVPAFLSDSLSTTLTIQHILALPDVVASTGTEPTMNQKLVVHIVGAALSDEAAPGRYVELSRLNPQLTALTVHLIGPHVQMTTELANRVIPVEGPRPTCDVSIQCHNGLYHTVDADLLSECSPPSIIFCPHSGVEDPGYTDSWRPSLEYILDHYPDVPLVLTGYNSKEVEDDTALLHEWGARIVVPPTSNRFRGLRPYLDPAREPHDVIYTNASFVVIKGRRS